MAIAQIVQQALKPLGITVKIRTIDVNQIFTTQGKGDYQMSIDYWTMDIPDPDEDTQFFLSPNGGGNCYFTHYNNPTMTAAGHRRRPRNSTRPSGRSSTSRSSSSRITDLPQLYLYYSPYPYAYSSKVQGFLATPLGNMHMEDVWLSK